MIVMNMMVKIISMMEKLTSLMIPSNSSSEKVSSISLRIICTTRQGINGGKLVLVLQGALNLLYIHSASVKIQQRKIRVNAIAHLRGIPGSVVPDAKCFEINRGVNF